MLDGLFLSLYAGCESTSKGIGYPSLIMAICASCGVTWANNEKVGFTMKPVDANLIVDFLKEGPPKKHPHYIAGESSSSFLPMVQTVHTQLDHMEPVLDYHE